jgi:hypothetical protein
MAIYLHWVLLLGVALNWYGAISGLTSIAKQLGKVQGPPDYWILRFFLAGAAATFGAMYLYLFFRPEFVWPFLIFGAALKTWVLVYSIYLYRVGALSKDGLNQFGISNGIVAVGFWAYLAALLQ